MTSSSSSSIVVPFLRPSFPAEQGYLLKKTPEKATEMADNSDQYRNLELERVSATLSSASPDYQTDLEANQLLTKLQLIDAASHTKSGKTDEGSGTPVLKAYPLLRLLFGLTNAMCRECPAMFRTSSALKRHCEERHSSANRKYLGKNTYRCSFCRQKVPRAANKLEEHLKAEHGLNLLQYLKLVYTGGSWYDACVLQCLHCVQGYTTTSLELFTMHICGHGLPLVEYNRLYGNPYSFRCTLPCPTCKVAADHCKEDLMWHVKNHGMSREAVVLMLRTNCSIAEESKWCLDQPGRISGNSNTAAAERNSPCEKGSDPDLVKSDEDNDTIIVVHGHPTNEVRRTVYNRCIYQCPICLKRIQPLYPFQTHMRDRHQQKMTWAMAEKYMSQRVNHTCNLCKKVLLCDRLVVGTHTRNVHKLSINEYFHEFGENNNAIHWRSKSNSERGKEVLQSLEDEAKKRKEAAAVKSEGDEEVVLLKDVSNSAPKDPIEDISDIAKEEESLEQAREAMSQQEAADLLPDETVATASEVAEPAVTSPAMSTNASINTGQVTKDSVFVNINITLPASEGTATNVGESAKRKLCDIDTLGKGAQAKKVRSSFPESGERTVTSKHLQGTGQSQDGVSTAGDKSLAEKEGEMPSGGRESIAANEHASVDGRKSPLHEMSTPKRGTLQANTSKLSRAARLALQIGVKEELDPDDMLERCILCGFPRSDCRDRTPIWFHMHLCHNLFLPAVRKNLGSCALCQTPLQGANFPSLFRHLAAKHASDMFKKGGDQLYRRALSKAQNVTGGKVTLDTLQALGKQIKAASMAGSQRKTMELALSLERQLQLLKQDQRVSKEQGSVDSKATKRDETKTRIGKDNEEVAWSKQVSEDITESRQEDLPGEDQIAMREQSDSEGSDEQCAKNKNEKDEHSKEKAVGKDGEEVTRHKQVIVEGTESRKEHLSDSDEMTITEQSDSEDLVEQSEKDGSEEMTKCKQVSDKDSGSRKKDDDDSSNDEVTIIETPGCEDSAEQGQKDSSENEMVGGKDNEKVTKSKQVSEDNSESRREDLSDEDEVKIIEQPDCENEEHGKEKPDRKKIGKRESTKKEAKGKPEEEQEKEKSKEEKTEKMSEKKKDNIRMFKLALAKTYETKKGQKTPTRQRDEQWCAICERSKVHMPEHVVRKHKNFLRMTGSKHLAKCILCGTKIKTGQGVAGLFQHLEKVHKKVRKNENIGRRYFYGCLKEFHCYFCKEGKKVVLHGMKDVDKHLRESHSKIDGLSFLEQWQD